MQNASIYSKENIALWNLQIEELSEEIQSEQHNLVSYKDILKTNENALLKLAKTINAKQQELLNKKNQISEYGAQIWSSISILPLLTKNIGAPEKNEEDLQQLNLEQKELSEQLQVLQLNEASLRARMAEEELAIETSNARKIQMELEQIELHNKIANAEFFLADLKSDPGSIFNQALENIEQFIQAEQQNNPLDTHFENRLCLFELSTKLAIIKKDLASEPTVEAQRQAYTQLCFIIWHLVERFSKNKLLNAILTFIHLDKEDLCVQSQSSAWNPDLSKDIEAEDFAQIELTAFKNAHAALEEQIKKLKPNNTFKALKQQCQHLLNETEHYKNIYKKKPETDSDIKFVSTVLTETSNLLKNPYNTQLKRQYRHLSTYRLEEQAQKNKQRAGIILNIVGCVIAIGAIVACIFAPPLTAPVVATLASCAVTSGTCSMLGFGLFEKGAQKGLSARISNLSKANNKAFALR